MSRTYPEPFVPSNFSCWITRTTTKLKVTDRSTGQQRLQAADRWDVKGRADGIEFAKRFARAGLAESWRDQLERGHAAGLCFDLAAKRFVSPAPPPSPEAPTVFSLTEAFYWSHPEWEPATKEMAATAYNRARRWLLDPGAALEPTDARAVEDYLAHGTFIPTHLDQPLTEAQVTGRAWLQQHSAPADSLTTGQLEEFVARFSLSQRDPTRRISPTTIVRYTQPLRACWAWALARDDISVERNPWLAVRTPRKVKGKASPAADARGRLAVDADLVITPDQAVALAGWCAQEGRWGGVVICFVLVMALCGLRPGEAVGLIWEDVELSPDGGAGWLTVRRSRRRSSPRWLDPDEDPEWGPLKDRDLAETRRVPIHPDLASFLATHRRVLGDGPGGLVFHRNCRPFDMDMFGRDVWEPGRSVMFPPRSDLRSDDPRQPKLSRLRRHDLRHAACSWWLREGVDATVCQGWSGHRTLSVFLDVYQGVAPGREDEGIRRLVDSFGF